MVIKMKKINKKKVDISIIAVVAVVFITLITIAMREASYTQTWLVCEKDVTDDYHEVLKFRYDADNKLYAYYREELVHDMTPEGIETNKNYFNDKLEQVKSNINENFKYEIISNDDSILVKTFILVKVYPNFFNTYIASEEINNNSTVDEINKLLTDDNYKCNITRK